MKNVWQVIGIGIVTVSLLGTITAEAQRRRGHGPCGRGGIQSILSAIDLTQEQQDQIDAVRDAHRDASQTLREEIQAVKQATAEALLAPGDLPADFVAAQAAALAPLTQQRIEARLTKQIDIRNILTDAQRAEAAALLEDRQALCEEFQATFGDDNTDETAQ